MTDPWSSLAVPVAGVSQTSGVRRPAVERDAVCWRGANTEMLSLLSGSLRGRVHARTGGVLLRTQIARGGTFTHEGKTKTARVTGHVRPNQRFIHDLLETSAQDQASPFLSPASNVMTEAKLVQNRARSSPSDSNNDRQAIVEPVIVRA